jgi:hypothetical protein
MQRPAVGTAEHQTMISEASTHQQALSQLPLPMLPQCGDGSGVECDRTPPACCLRCPDLDVVMHHDHRLRDRCSPGRKIDVRPAQTQGLAASHARRCQQNECGVQPVFCGVIQEGSNLISGPGCHRRADDRGRARWVRSISGVSRYPTPSNCVTERPVNDGVDIADASG